MSKSWREGKTTAQRGYNNRWRKARATYLASHPLCAMCEQQGRVTAAAVVDHVKAHRGDQALFWQTDNWQALCAPCHDIHAQSRDKSGHEMGGDATGRPFGRPDW